MLAFWLSIVLVSFHPSIAFLRVFLFFRGSGNAAGFFIEAFKGGSLPHAGQTLARPMLMGFPCRYPYSPGISRVTWQACVSATTWHQGS